MIRTRLEHQLAKIGEEIMQSYKENARIAQVQIVDLAGREQEKKSGDDRDRLRERAFINKSLFHLSTCISNLARNSGRKIDWAFRNSKLTLVLAHSP